MLDTSAIGDVIAKAMHDLEEEYSEGRVRSVALVVEVDNDERSTKWSVHGDDRLWMQRVVLEMGLGQIDVQAMEVVTAEEDDDA